ncbi:MAG TPA: thioredoxin-dependent thiol peroxidase [Rhodothermales bacterium]|nr:thioredoxin-dependent thiol peroxidase [Rhodothermales bacterium]
MSTMPTVGDTAPAFSGTTQNGETVSLSDFAGQRVALYFYPKDDTPGCTKQACNLRDHYQDLLDADVAVVGVSPDNTASHEQFAEKYDLPFPLIADPDHEILNAYGVWGERNLYGNRFMGVKRTTFLIDADGTIVHIFKRPKVSEHTAEVLAKFEAVSG